MSDKRQRTYIAIDLKSFFASVECVERGLDPLTTNLLVADTTRTDKTICLAVSPSLKAIGVPGRPRLFEAQQIIRHANMARRMQSYTHTLKGKSANLPELRQHPDWEIDYIAAMPHMQKYIDYSTRVYAVYLKHVASEDMHIYSVDEVFIDATAYLETNAITAHDFAMRMIRDVLSTTGITATAGIGTNMYLAKVAMDIVAKHQEADKDGVRIAHLDEESYRQELWSHTPLTDFWRIGPGIESRLRAMGLRTQGDIALQSVKDEEPLYRAFGINAELLIDHAWGWEPCTIEEIKRYRPETHSLSNGQVLMRAYTRDEARTVVMEMTDELALGLVEKRLVCNQLQLYLGYDRTSLAVENGGDNYHGEMGYDHYGRLTPKPAHASAKLEAYTSSDRKLRAAIMTLFEKIADRKLLIRRINISAGDVVGEDTQPKGKIVAADIFSDPEELRKKIEEENRQETKERKMQEALLNIKHRFGKNAILKGLNFGDGATARDRNRQIGGHKA